MERRCLWCGWIMVGRIRSGGALDVGRLGGGGSLERVTVCQQLELLVGCVLVVVLQVWKRAGDGLGGRGVE